jgi:LEA14-like dessication related protein
MRTRLLVFFALLVLAGCSALPINAVPPKVSVADIDIKSLGLFEQHFDVGLRLANPNEFDLGIEALDFELELNGQPFAKGMARSPTLIPAVSSVVLRVDAITQSENLIQQIKTLPPETLREGVPYRIKGRIKTDKSSGWLPFEQQGVYGGGEKKPEGIAI